MKKSFNKAPIILLKKDTNFSLKMRKKNKIQVILPLLGMCLYLNSKFQVSSIILVSFRQGVGLRYDYVIHYVMKFWHANVTYTTYWYCNRGSIYLFKVKNESTRTISKIHSKITIKTSERRHWRILNLKQILYIFLAFPFLSLNKKMLVGNAVHDMSYTIFWCFQRV